MILILGTPGAGKTTQTGLLAEYLNCKWFSMGELIRAEVTGQDRQAMLAGKIIGDKVTLNIVDKALASFDPAKEECIFEGNPRSVPQAQWWIAQTKAGRFNIKGLVHLTASPDVAETRMTKRGRLDDHDEGVVEKRFEEYKRSISPTINYLKDNGVHIHEVDADGTVVEVAELIHQALGV
jgi:adenylate kinase